MLVIPKEQVFGETTTRKYHKFAYASSVGVPFLTKLHGKKQKPGSPRLTPPKFNMEPENDGFQKESPFPGTSFQVPC